MPKLHELSLETILLEQPGKKWKQRKSSTPSSVEEFCVNGVRLSDSLSIGGHISPLGWGHEVYQRQQLRWLMLEDVCEELGGRVPLYVCHLCGDFACGVFSVRITRDGDRVVWDEFRWEERYEGFVFEQPAREKYFKRIFDYEEYMTLLRKKLESLGLED